MTNSADRSANIAFETFGQSIRTARASIHPSRARPPQRTRAIRKLLTRARCRVARISRCRAAVGRGQQIRHAARHRAEEMGRGGGFMDARLRRRLEMAVRVRDFLRAHRTDGVAEGTALARLEELVQRAEVLAAQQRAGIVATRAATEMRAEVRRALRSKLLLYLSAVGGWRRARTWSSRRSSGCRGWGRIRPSSPWRAGCWRRPPRTRSCS